jgi:phosphatidate cytidylyltransferase
MNIDRTTLVMMGGVIGLLALATIIVAILKRGRSAADLSPAIANLEARVRAWWVMVAIFSVALLIGPITSVLLFALVSFFALREFLTLTPTRRADHQALFLSFFVILPAQYLLVAIQWYGLFAVLIPVYGSVIIAVRCAASGDCQRFLERTAEIQWALLVCVYFVSHVPALLMLEIPGYAGANARLLLFFVLVVQLSDVLQYVWGKLLGRRQIAPALSPNKTLEGFVGGALSATVVGAALWWATPFTVWQAAVFSLLITIMGFFGGLVMSAIKRDRRVKDYGTMIEGHGGVMDRIDSISFAAPVFFHLVRFYFVP